IGDGPDGPISVEGHVDESKLFSTQVRMAATVTTLPGANWLTVRDEFLNLGDSPQEMQVLYHWNFGPPFLEKGARFLAPCKQIMPRDARAIEGLSSFDIYDGPEPGFAEQVYLFELLGEPGAGLGGPGPSRTLAMLRDRAGGKALVLRFDRAQLPAFTLWKNTGGLKSGYVTGLEPGTNYPNPKPFEKARRRVVVLPPGGSYVTETTLEVLTTADQVVAIEDEIRGLQRQGAAVIHEGPVEPFAAP
ncbi:MAG: aldose 1-epimerase family protein, partial [Planctomycetia bacterium]|nr:aldose 1-epimerase family protein [Planctomycetia bacterium]